MKFILLCLCLLFLTAITLCDEKVTIVGQISEQFLSATVGGSVLIPCSLPGPPLRLRWFYWQEDKSSKILFHWDPNGQTQPIAVEYKNRCQVFSIEFSSGNISIRLDNVTVRDDKKTFWAYVCLMDEKNITKPSEQLCKFTLQVSAPYQHLVLTVNNTANRATCTAHGGYPEPKVSWTGRKKSSSAQLDLQDAETSLQQDPTEETFSVTSSVSMKEFQSVTCIIFNPRTNQRIKGTAEISASDEEPESYTSLAVGLGVGLPLSIIITLLIVYLYRKHKRYIWNPQNQQNQGNQEIIGVSRINKTNKTKDIRSGGSVYNLQVINSSGSEKEKGSWRWLC